MRNSEAREIGEKNTADIPVLSPEFMTDQEYNVWVRSYAASSDILIMLLHPQMNLFLRE